MSFIFKSAKMRNKKKLKFMQQLITILIDNLDSATEKKLQDTLIGRNLIPYVFTYCLRMSQYSFSLFFSL